jgi:hypothetical protein
MLSIVTRSKTLVKKADLCPACQALFQKPVNPAFGKISDVVIYKPPHKAILVTKRPASIRWDQPIPDALALGLLEAHDETTRLS